MQEYWVKEASVWIGICLWEKTKRLKVTFEMIPNYEIFISNDSSRTVNVIRLSCSVNKHVFYVKAFNGLKEKVLHPYTTASVQLDTKEIFNQYYQAQADAFANPKDPISIVIRDHRGRKYTVKTEFGISGFKTE